MSNQSEQTDIGIVPLQTLFDNLKNNVWKYHIEHENGRDIKGSVQLKARIYDVKTNTAISSNNVTIKASGITIKNGPYTEKGQLVPKDVLRAAEKFEKTFKTNIEFGTKSSGLLGEFTEWFAENAWPSAVKDAAIRYGLTEPGHHIVPFSIYKKTYGSKTNPGDSKKKAIYMETADWKFNLKIRGNTKSHACFGFTLCGYEPSASGVRKVEVPVTAKNMSTWFRGGNRGIMIYEISDVTLNSNSTVHTFYHGRTPVEFHLKRETRKKEYKDAITTDEMADLCGEIGMIDVDVDTVIDIDNGDISNQTTACGSDPASPSDIEEQLKQIVN
jgi:hypothetical protein